MRRKAIFLMLILIGTIFCLSACNKKVKTEELPHTLTIPTITISPIPSIEPYDIEIKQFMEDAKIPPEIYEKFATAIKGDLKSQEWLEKYDDENQNKYWSVLCEVFPSIGSYVNLEIDCYSNIGTLYYYGDEDIQLKQNKEKAYYWLKLAATKGSFFGAIQAGDMAKSGDGVSVNEKMAFELYKKAFELENNSMAFERLANCYENGIGTNIDEQKAQEYYFQSALDGNPKALYKLSMSGEISPNQSVLFIKAASSMDYSADYFDMVYGGLDTYFSDEMKLEEIGRLTKAWDNGTDPMALQLKKAICRDQYFSKVFVEELIKVSYTYSYHSFAEKYGIEPNRSFKDGKNIQFDLSKEKDEFFSYESEAKKYLEYEECEFYELDFDGDGENEIGIPLHSGAGGAFMMDGFGIFKKNKKGLYKIYAGGPDCTMRDAMRLIQYNGRVYFITNPFSDTMDAPHNITARVIGENGTGHDISVNCKEYKPKEIMTKVYDIYSSDEFDGFMKEVMAQTYEAIAATKKHEMYNSTVTKQVKTNEETESYYTVSSLQDVYFTADINNDNTEVFVRKGHMITQDKYYNDNNLFQIYHGESELLDNAKPMLDFIMGDYYGLHSDGNVYDILPVRGKIVQFWSHEKDNMTYCLALTRNELLYSLNVYIIQNKRAIPVCNSILFDEVQKVDIIYSQE